VGAQRTGKGISRDVVLDAGALIAFEKGDGGVKATLKAALVLGARIVVPASAFAQVWRGGPRSASLARFIDAGEIDILDEERAKEIGVRLGSRDAGDIADAHVVCCALPQRAAVLTSNPNDIRALVEPGETLTLIPV
jgi:hypothetical protein